MNYALFLLKSALFDFSHHKGRTVLTSLGILIGVLSVVLLSAFGLGLKVYIRQQFENLGTNILVVLPGQPLRGGGFRTGPGAFSAVRFDEKDYTELRKVKNAIHVAPVFSKNVTISYKNESQPADLISTSADLFPARNLTADLGRVFSREDNEKKSKVIVIGPKLAEQLFGDKNSALDNKVKISGQSFKVIGILESKGGGGFGGPDFDTFVYIPYRTGFTLSPEKKFVNFILKAESAEKIPALKEEIVEKLSKHYENDEFQVVEQTEILQAIGSIFNIVNTVLVAIAAVSLVVGGIGIMNIMYVSVSERMKEIGIRRAVGARKKDVLFQFLVESSILSLFGGTLGVLVAIIITLLIQPLFPAQVSLESVLVALIVSSVIGVLFGVLPARKAANLSPIEAIRYE